MSKINYMKELSLAIAIIAVLSACDDGASSKKNPKADVAACRGEVQKAVERAVSQGKSDLEIKRAGSEALDICMMAKGY